MWDFNHQNMGFRWISHCLTNKRGKIGCFHKRHLQAAGTTEKRARNERDWEYWYRPCLTNNRWTPAISGIWVCHGLSENKVPQNWWFSYCSRGQRVGIPHFHTLHVGPLEDDLNFFLLRPGQWQQIYCGIMSNLNFRCDHQGLYNSIYIYIHVYIDIYIYIYIQLYIIYIYIRTYIYIYTFISIVSRVWVTRFLIQTSNVTGAAPRWRMLIPM